MAVQITGVQIKDNAVSADKIIDGSVSADKLAADCVTSAKIVAGAVDTAAVDSLAITTAKIANNGVTPAKADLTATWDFSGGTIRVPSTPSDDNDAVCKSYLDGIVGGGVYWKEPAVAASTANINLANPGTDTFDGIQLSSGQRLLVKDQSTANQNGVYDFNGSGSALTRSSDANAASELNGLAIFVKSGTASADQGFIQTNEISNLGSDNVTFVQFTGLGQITAGAGLAKSGNTISANVGNGLIIDSDNIEISFGGGVTSSEGDLTLDVDDTTVEISAGVLQVKAIGASQLSSNAVTTIKINDSAITTAKINDDSITTAKVAAGAIGTTELTALGVTTAKIANANVDENKLASSVAGAGLAGGAGTALSVNVDSSTISISGDTLAVTSLGIDTAQIAAGAVNALKIANGAVTAVKLNSNVAGDGLSLDASTNALEVEVGDGLAINGDNEVQVTLKSQGGLSITDGDIQVVVDDSTIEKSSLSGAVKIKAGGVGATQLATNACTTAKVANGAITIAKTGFKFYQELSAVSGSGTQGIDLARDLEANAMAGVLVFKNGLAMLNKTALGGSASDSDSFTVANDGAGSTGKITFGANLADGDNILIHYWDNV
tara:strand:- start:7755 stop:9581 length:1827 start_codon:yes stop_codon:yes gene_type:complete